MKQKFIITQDEQTAKMLLASDFKLVNHIGKNYTFLNDVQKSLNFANFDNSKIVHSNILSM